MKHTVSLTRSCCLLLVVVLLSGCGRPEASTSQDEDQAPLGGIVNWALISLTQDGKEIALPSEGRKLTLEFVGHRLRGYCGCNSLDGQVTLQADGQLVLNNVGATEMACADQEAMQREAAYLSVLLKMTQYEVKDRTLTLSDGGTENELRFTPAK